VDTTVLNGHNYTYTLEEIGTWTGLLRRTLGSVEVTPMDVGGRQLEAAVSFGVSAFPNPFNSELQIEFEVPRSGLVELAVFNVLGQKVAMLLNERREIGHHAITWRPDGAGGVYFVSLRTATVTKTMKVLYLP
jgi:hypothetical protein